MRKGFTLIELLAVIVILAIIALIATPIVLSIINQSKESAQLRSAEMYVKGLETSIATAILHEQNVPNREYGIAKGNLCLGTVEGTGEDINCVGGKLEVQMNGEVPQSGTVIVTDGQITDISFTYKNGKTIVMDENKDLIFEDSKELAQLKSSEKYIKSLESSIIKEIQENGKNIQDGSYSITRDGNLCLEYLTNEKVCNGETLKVEMNGETPISGTVKIASGKVTNVSLKYKNGKTIVYDDEGKLVYSDEEESVTLAAGLYKEDGTFISWENLTSTEYQSFTYTNQHDQSVTTGILNVDENGVLTAAYDYDWPQSIGKEYLEGKLVIPNTVSSIDYMAFTDCYQLTSITIPESVISIDDSAFTGCSGLNSITVSQNNPVYDSRNNCNAIIETTTNTLVIGSNNTVIPQGVIKIGREAFDSRVGLTSITIPDSVSDIGYNAIYGCVNLKIINYAGTKNQWQSIVFDEYWNWACPEITVHCSDGDIIIPAFWG